MRGLTLFIVTALTLTAIIACSTTTSTNSGAGPASTAADDRERLSYGIGYYLGQEVHEGLEYDGVDVDPDLVARGFSTGLRDAAPWLDPDELEAVMAVVHAEMETRRVAKLLEEDADFLALHDDNLARGEAYLANMAGQPGVQTLPEGLLYRETHPGHGAVATEGDEVVVNFHATLIDGTPIAEGQPAVLDLEDVVPGAFIILTHMPVGAKWEVAIPSDLAFGPAGDPPIVGPNETVLVEAEVLEVRPRGEERP